jgi:hypothetical protein
MTAIALLEGKGVTFPEKLWEEETLDLIQDQQEERRKLESRLAAIQQQLEKCDQLIVAYRLTLEGYRAKYGLAKSGPEPLTDHDKAVYLKLHPKDVVNRWADSHGGTVVMNELCLTMVAIHAFSDTAQAASTLYSAIRRMTEYEKVERGVYRRRLGHTGSLVGTLVVSGVTDADLAQITTHNGAGKSIEIGNCLSENADDLPF